MLKLELEKSRKVTEREAIMLNPLALEWFIKEEFNEQQARLTENIIKDLLDKRPRYSKWIPVKLYMKFHTIWIQRGEIKSYREIWKWFTLVQKDTVFLERRKFRDLF